MNFKLIIRLIGLLLIVEAFAMLASLGVDLLLGGEDVKALAISAFICLVPGIIAFSRTARHTSHLSRREGFFAVTLAWLVVSLTGAMPYLLSGFIPNPINAFFESMSGFTTTGASILENVEELPKGLLFWRAMTHWLGGMGIIVLALSFLPAFGIGGMQLFNAESPGVSVDKVSPRLYQTARRVWGIYILFTALETLLLMFGGMSWFDGICHAFATMATGGFSTKQASIAFWQSPFIDYVITFFMIIAGTNFTLLYMGVTGRPKKLFRDEEFRNYLMFILIFTLLVFSGLVITSPNGIGESFRHSLFTVTSILTTTGFVTADYLKWSPFLTLLVFAVFFLGGSTGSTGGGVKIMRILILLKNSWYELRRMIHPHAVIPVRFNRTCVDQKIVNNIVAFFIFYTGIFFIGSVIFMLFAPDMATSMGAVASCLGNIGPGLGTVGPVNTYAHLPGAGKLFLSFLMMIGRLELFTVLVIFSPAFWRK